MFQVTRNRVLTKLWARPHYGRMTTYTNAQGLAAAILRHLDVMERNLAQGLTPSTGLRTAILAKAEAEASALRPFDAYAGFYARQNVAHLLAGGHLDALRQRYDNGAELYAAQLAA